MSLFVTEAIGEFRKAAACSVTLVFDRGFAAPTIVEYLCKQQILFVVRLKGDKRVLGRKSKAAARWLAPGLGLRQPT
jgi:hypothetical protein